MGLVIAENKQIFKETPDKRGRISAGEPIVCTKCHGKNADKCQRCQGKGFLPKSLDYFNVTKFPEIMAVYGDKPTKLIVTYPPFGSNIDDFLTYIYGTYNSANRRARICNLEQFYVKYDQKVPDNEKNNPENEFFGSKKEEFYKAGKGKEKIFYPCMKPYCACGCLFMPMFFVLHPDKPKALHNQPIMFRTKSEESAPLLYTALRKYAHIIRGMIFELTVTMVNDGTKKFPSFDLKPVAHINPEIGPADLKIGGILDVADNAQGMMKLSGNGQKMLEAKEVTPQKDADEYMKEQSHKEFEQEFNAKLDNNDGFKPTFDVAKGPLFAETEEKTSAAKSAKKHEEKQNAEADKKSNVDKAFEKLMELVKVQKSSKALAVVKEKLNALELYKRPEKGALNALKDKIWVSEKAFESPVAFDPDQLMEVVDEAGIDEVMEEVKKLLK